MSDKDRHDGAAVAEALAAYEEKLGDLYAVYAVKYSRAADLWQSLSAEEYGHASLITDLGRSADGAVLFADRQRFHVPEIVASRRFVSDQIKVAEATHLSLVEALESAADLEQQAAEQRAYEVHDGDPENARRVLNHLRDESLRHRERILARLASLDRSHQ